MSEEQIACFRCNFRCCKTQIYKTAGKCPKCGQLIDVNINNQAKAAGMPNA